jgi:hypothetical protein
MSATLDSAEFVLIDNWPTIGNNNSAGPFNAGAPASGADQNAATEVHQVGTKWTGYQEGSTGINRGAFTLIYLQFGTAAATACAVKQIVALETAPGAATAATLMYKVTNSDATAELGTGMAAVALSAMTASYYGWFWCGGVCPESICAGLAGNHLTQGSVVVGDMSLGQADGDNALMGYIVSSAGLRACGVSFVIDVA